MENNVKKIIVVCILLGVMVGLVLWYMTLPHAKLPLPEYNISLQVSYNSTIITQSCKPFLPFRVDYVNGVPVNLTYITYCKLPQLHNATILCHIYFNKTINCVNYTFVGTNDWNGRILNISKVS